MPDPKVYAQIESTADFNPPGTYAFSPSTFLTYYNDLTVAEDPLAAYYIPLSAVAQRGVNPKLFAIGVIPPAVNLTGNLLDRKLSSTASTAVDDATTGAGQTYVGTVAGVAADRSTYIKDMVDWATNPPKGRSTSDPTYQTVVEGRNNDTNKAYSSCGELPQWMLYNLGVRSDIINRVENTDATYKPGQNSTNLAFNRLSKGISSKTQYNTGDTIFIWNKPTAHDLHTIVVLSQTVDSGGNVTQLKTGEYGQPGGNEFTRDITYKNSDGDIVPAGTPDSTPFMGERQIQRILPLASVLADAAKKGQLVDDIRLPNDAQNGVAADGKSTAWTGDKADAARKQQQKLANTPLIADAAGQAFQAAQRAQYLAVKGALDAMANSPPLRMLVNPKSFSVKGEKIVSDGSWGRNGPIIEHWGNNQDKISASGKVSGFYAVSIEDAGGPGLTRMARNFSQAWQNFQSLYLFYKNNGALYTKDFASGSNQVNLALVGSIYIYYDNILYIGSFDNFSLSEDDAAPFSMDYSYDFTVRAAFLLDQPDTLTYGRVTDPNAGSTVPNSASLIQTTSAANSQTLLGADARAEADVVAIAQPTVPTTITAQALTGINGPF